MIFDQVICVIVFKGESSEYEIKNAHIRIYSF